MSSSEVKIQRTRNYACIVYPESAPVGWLAQLQDLHIDFAVSPLHDKDINPYGELKKPHYHVMLMYDSVKTKVQAIESISSFGGVGCERINAIRNYARYLCHLDNPEKWKYKESDVITSGVDYYDLISLPSDKYGIIRDMMHYCYEHCIIHYCDLLDYASKEHDDWFRILCDSGTLVMKEFMRSLDYKSRKA